MFCPPPLSLLNLNAFLLTKSLPVLRICTHIHLEATQAYLGNFSHFFPGAFCAFSDYDTTNSYNKTQVDVGKDANSDYVRPSATRLHLQPSQEQTLF